MQQRARIMAKQAKEVGKFHWGIHISLFTVMLSFLILFSIVLDSTINPSSSRAINIKEMSGWVVGITAAMIALHLAYCGLVLYMKSKGG